MKLLRTQLPPLNALVIFEAAGRLASFTRAAEELNMTQAAVSYGVKQLEAALAVDLFRREHQRVRLTEDGRRYHQDVTLALEHIRRSTETLRRSQSGTHVTLSCSTAFASWWMLPRLAQFRLDNPGIDLRLQTTDKDIDLDAEGVSLGIRRGDGRFLGLDAVKMVDEAIIPVCSPAYIERAGPIASVADLKRQRLIHLDEPFRPRPNWADYFRAAGVPADRDQAGLHLNDYALVVGAALEGQGIALGWRHQTDHLVARGLLTHPIDQPWITGLAFHIVWPHGIILAPEAEIVRDWLAGNPPIPAPSWPVSRDTR
ncbi:LysR substrate-binding domain-containing protein [Dongia sp.]|jgi:DNA-binding transcriptional LysR family regulator|uniref:LysR substrate-binding domain-containing protein n=1 Tax=Dongia sp. TaxID=1977262 RepID=UPI0035AEE195